MRRGLYPLSVLLAAAAMAPLVGFTAPALADPPGDAAILVRIARAEPAPAQLDLLATAGTWLTSEFDQRPFDVERFEASLPVAEPQTIAPDRRPAIVAAAKPDEHKSPRKPAANRPRGKSPTAKSSPPVGPARSTAEVAPARTSIPPGRGIVAAAAPATALHRKPRAAATARGPRMLIIARVAPSDADEVMPAQPVTPVTRAALPPPSPSVALK